MSNIGSTLAKAIIFAGGIFAGIMLSEWIDRLLAKQEQEQSEHDGNYYAQGLQPYSHPPSDEDYQAKR
jgi:hypothetical protein